MQSIPVPLGVVNRNGEIIHFNDRFTQVFGYSQADMPTLTTGGGSPIPIRRIGVG